MVRIAYFGTDGCPGHYAIPIRGKFTEEDIKVIESVDCDDFYSESFFDVYDRDGMKLIYSIQNSILKEMFVI